QSDLYLFNTKTNQLSPLTHDPFDDLNAVFSSDGKEIYFSSNRENQGFHSSNTFTFIPSDSSSYDIYSFQYLEKSSNLKRITSTPYIHEKNPQPYSRNSIAYQSDNNGIFNTYTSMNTDVFDKAWVLIYGKNNTGIIDTFY